MENEERNKQYDKNIYIYKILYLIRTNLPSSENIYIIMFLLKYLGLILLSHSLNEWNNEIDHKKEPHIKNINEMAFSNQNKSIQAFLSKFIINGNNLKMLNKYYQILCSIGFCMLIIFILFIIYWIFYMRKKYYNKKIKKPIEIKIKKIKNSSKIEKRIFSLITYISFFIIFFHQYIIEYYFFGLLISFLHILGFFDKELANNIIIDEYSRYINDYLKYLKLNSITMMIICLISIIIIILIFAFFMAINNTKTLFINIGFPFYGNNSYLFFKMIIYNYNSIYGLIHMFRINIKIKILLIFLIINIIIILINIVFVFYKFSFYPSKLGYICIFIEFFCFFSIITELIIYFSNSSANSIGFIIIKLIIELSNSVIFTIFFIYKKKEFNLNLFSNNLFNKSFNNLNSDDIYYYIESFSKYEKNKNNNYLKLYKIFQNHLIACNKNDCPCTIIIPKSIAYSPNQKTNNNSINDDDNKNNLKNNNINIINNKPKLEDIYKLQNNSITYNILHRKTLNKIDVDKSKLKIKESNKYLNKFINENEDFNVRRKRAYSTRNVNKMKERNTTQSILRKVTNKKKNSIIQEKKDISIIKETKKENNKNEENETNKEKENKEKEEKEENEKLTDEQFKIIGEQEITNRISFLYKHKKYDVLEIYIFIHLQYLIKVKSNYRLALYFIGKYSLCEIKFSFLSKYYLYEIKKYIIKNIFHLINYETVKDTYIQKYRHENMHMQKIINYFDYYHMIKKLLKISCEKYIYFYSFCSELHNPLLYQKYKKLKIYPIINSAKEIQSSISNLKFLIQKYFKKEKHPVKSIELSFLIINFFKLIEGKISQDIMKCVTPISNIKKIYYENNIKEFRHLMMSNPLIIYLTQKDTFNIIYFSNIFLDKLGYSYDELKNQDFHKKLFPGQQELIKEHTFLLKQFLFLDKNIFSKNKTFLKSKDGYLVPINFICKSFPNFNHDFYLIANIMFNEDNLQTNEYQSNFLANISANNFNNNLKTYSFFLNYDLECFAITKNFYTEYKLNQNMFRELNMNFCQFFCINENKLFSQINKEIRKLIKNFPNYNNKITLKEINKLFSIFNNVEIKNVFKIIDEKLLENFFYSTGYIYDKINKNKIIMKIPEIIKNIDEKGLDYDWNIRIQNFKERLINNNSSNANDSKASNSECEKENRALFLKSKNSSIEEQNIFEHKHTEQYFEVEYLIKKLGSLSYYIVNLYETINNDNTRLNDAINNKNKRPDERINIEKLSSNGNQRNRFFSISSKLKNSNKIKIEETKSIQRNAKTKVFASELLRKSSALTDVGIKNVKILENVNIAKEKMKPKFSTDNSINIKNSNSKGIIKVDNNIYGKYKYELDNPKNNKYLIEEENITLMTKNELKIKLKKINNMNNKLILSFFLICSISLILIITNFIISMISFQQSKNIFEAMMNLEMLKSDIYMHAVLSILYCINELESYTDIKDIKLEEEQKMDLTMKHIKEFQNKVGIIINNKISSKFINILYEEYTIKNLNDDWSISEEKINLMNEIRSFSYKIYELLNASDVCNISNTFYKYKEINSEIFEKGKVTRANEIQKIFYYFLTNIFTTYKAFFDKLLEESANIIQDVWDNYQKIPLFLIFSTNLLMITFIILYIIKVCFDYSYYQLLFLFYYENENIQAQFEMRIFYLYKTIVEFNNTNVKYFEYAKQNGDLSYYKYEIRKNSLSNNNNFPFSEKIKNNEKLKLKNEDKNKNNILSEENSKNGNILNSSLNGSSFQFLNNINNNKISFNNDLSKNSYFPQYIDKKDKKDSQEDSINSLIQISNKFLPISLKISLIIVLFSALIYIIISCSNIIQLYIENKIWKFTSNLSMNILEEIPSLMELFLYSCFSIIIGSENIMKNYTFNDNLPIYINYFKANSLYYSEDIINNNLNNSFFSKLLINNNRIFYNLDNYLFQDKNNIFQNTKKWELLFRKNGYFCIYSAIAEISNSQKNLSIYDFTEKINYLAKNCIDRNSAINESGIKVEINYIIQELTNKFIEFITYNNSNITLEQERKNFFGSLDIIRIIGDIRFSLLLYYKTISFSLNLDFNDKNTLIIIQEIVFSIALFFINFNIIIILIISIQKNERYKKLFGFFSEISN